VTPELLDRELDRRHRSFLFTILGENVGHVRSRTTRTLLPIHDLWVPKYVNWCYVIVCTFIYPFVVTNKLPYLFQATHCRTRACGAVSPGGQPVRCDSSKGSYDMVPVCLLPPQRASGPLEVEDPHVPLHHRWDDGDSSRHVPVDGPSLWGRAARGLQTSPPSGVRSYSLGSRTFLGTVALPPCTRSSRTLTDPPRLGCSSLEYVPLPHISLRFWRYGDNVTNIWFCFFRLIT
jgi:hypothetical protein